MNSFETAVDQWITRLVFLKGVFPGCRTPVPGHGNELSGCLAVIGRVVMAIEHIPAGEAKACGRERLMIEMGAMSPRVDTTKALKEDKDD